MLYVRNELSQIIFNYQNSEESVTILNSCIIEVNKEQTNSITTVCKITMYIKFEVFYNNNETSVIGKYKYEYKWRDNEE